MALNLWLVGLRGIWLGAWATSAPPQPLRTVRVGVPPATFLPWLTRNSAGEYDGGMLYEMYKEIAVLANFDIVYVPFDMYPNYWLQAEARNRQALDEDLVDMSWSLMPTPGYLASVPILTYPNVALTKKIKAASSMWQVFAPFQTGLWCAMAASIVFGALVMFVLTSIAGADSIDLKCLSNFPDKLYHTAAALLGGDEYDLYHVPHVGRLYRLGLLFLVLITSATYTANLAAYLTKPAFVVLGPQNLQELQRARKICSRWPSMAYALLAVVDNSQVVFPPAGMTESSDLLPWARELLQNGECDAIVDAEIVGVFESLEHCATMSLVRDIRFGYSSFSHIFRQNETELLSRMNVATSQHLQSLRYTELLQTHVGIGRSCSDASSADDELEGSEISVWQMSAAFIVFGACGVLSIIIVAVQRIRNGGPLRDTIEEVKNEKLDTHMVILDQKIDRLAEMDGKLDRLLEQFKIGATTSV